MTSLKNKAINIANKNDGKQAYGEAKKFLDNMQDLKNDGKLNKNDRDSAVEKKDAKDGKLSKKASLVYAVRSKKGLALY